MLFLITCNSSLCLTCVYDYELYWFYGNHVCIFIVLSFPFQFYYYSVSAFCGK